MLSVLLALEMMDKETTLPEIWLLAAACGILGFILGLWRPWLVVLPLFVLVVAAFTVRNELADPFVGSLIRQEAGDRYEASVYLALGLGAVVAIAGPVSRSLKRKRAA